MVMNMNLLKEKKLASLSLVFLTLIFSLMEFYVVCPIIEFEMSRKSSNHFEGILSGIMFVFLNLSRKLNITPMSLCIAVLLLLVVTFLIGALITVILCEINDFIRKRKTKIRKGIFVKVWAIVALTTLISMCFVICLIVAVLPALLITSMYIKGNMELIYCVFFDSMTILAILSLLIYVRIPIWRSLENAVLDEKKKTSDEAFKKLVVNYCIFDIIYILTRIIAISFFVNFDGLVMRLLLFVIFMIFNFIYEIIKTYSILDIFSKDIAIE